jgi:hypothetical protein
MISPCTCRKIRYGSRSDTAEIMPDRQSLPTTAGQRSAPTSGIPETLHGAAVR